MILDSNALFVPLQFRIDIFEETRALLGKTFEPVLLYSVKREIERLAKEGPPKIRKNASYALQLAEKCILVYTCENDGKAPDEVIIEVARKWKCPVFTNDRQLRKKLRNINVPVIYVRQKAHLVIDGRI